MTIYCDTNCAYHIESIGLSYTNDINQFILSPAPLIAVFRIPFPYDQGYGQAFEERVNLVYDNCDQIIILCSELHQRTIDFIQRYDRPKIVYFICGYLNQQPIHSRVYQWIDWFIIASDFYKHNTHVLDTIISNHPKNKIFDILLGQPKSQRTTIHNYINQHSHNEQVIMTYMTDYNKTIQQQNQSGWINEDGIEFPIEESKWTVTAIKYYGVSMTLSSVVPISIYNQTAYSIVAETNYENHYSFFTEKIVKPILAERLFLVFSGQHYLRNLRRLGFKTFDGIIDESYDNVEDTNLRFQLIFKQMEYLFATPQEEVLQQIHNIVQHNKRVMLETDWVGQFHANLKPVLTETK